MIFFIISYLFLSTLRPRIRPKISIVILVPFLNIIIDTTMPNPPSILHSKKCCIKYASSTTPVEIASLKESIATALKDINYK